MHLAFIVHPSYNAATIQYGNGSKELKTSGFPYSLQMDICGQLWMHPKHLRCRGWHREYRKPKSSPTGYPGVTTTFPHSMVSIQTHETAPFFLYNPIKTVTHSFIIDVDSLHQVRWLGVVLLGVYNESLSMFPTYLLVLNWNQHDKLRNKVSHQNLPVSRHRQTSHTKSIHNPWWNHLTLRG